MIVRCLDFLIIYIKILPDIRLYNEAKSYAIENLLDQVEIFDEYGVSNVKTAKKLSHVLRFNWIQEILTIV